MDTDVAAFDAAHYGDDPAGLRAAADRYAGDLLADSYDDWAAAERDEYRRRAAAVLHRLVALLEDGGDPAAAVGYAERARALEALAEAPYRALLRLYAAQAGCARSATATTCSPSRPTSCGAWRPPGATTTAPPAPT